MRLEKVNENEIRCILNRDDLIDRQLKLSELAYGSEKARDLFHDLIQQASYEFGFETDELPIVIEAIPIFPESLVLNITKVEDPEELDTRFSKFSQNNDSDILYEDNYENEILYNDSEFNTIYDQDFNDVDISVPRNIDENYKPKVKTINTNLIKIFSFNSLDEVINISNIINNNYNGENTLYKDPKTKQYYLVLKRNDYTSEEFNSICIFLSDFAKLENYSHSIEYYFKEHFEIIIKDNAIQVLSKIL